MTEKRKKREPQMDVRIGDRLKLKKSHPCGTDLFEVLRVGMDFRLRCSRCGHEFMMPRTKCEKSIKRLERPEEGAQAPKEQENV